MNFAALIAGAEGLDDGFRLTIPPSWHQGRTAYGGLSAALALEAARKVGGEGLAPLRSATISFVGPVQGTIEARARIERKGKNATWIAAELTHEGMVVLGARFVFMAPIASELGLPGCPPPAELIPVEQAAVYKPHAHMPVFLDNHFEVRFALPRSELKQPSISWWVRLREPEGIDPLTAMLLMADALPPGVLPLLSPATPISSMTWLANFLIAAPQTRDGWWLMRDSGEAARSGCASERLDIWNADGEHVVSGMQSVAVFG